jgi:hypothetical protein
MFFILLFHGLAAGDRTIKSSKMDETGPNTAIEEQEEKESVMKDLLRGELTEQVKELRYEMYHAERKSHEYVYNGGGNAVKNSFFSFSGNCEMSDGNPIKIVLPNKAIGVSIDNEKLIDQINEETPKLSKMSEQFVTKYSFEIERDFFPTFLIEKYTTQLVVKDVVEKQGKALLDFYIPSYAQQFNNVSKFFIKEMENIYNGDIKSDLLKINKVRFITKNCFGVTDSLLFEYSNPIFSEIIKYDGFYILRYYCDITINGYDTLEEIYHAPTAEKIENNAPRENASVNFEEIKLEQKKEDFDTSESEELFNKLYNIKKRDT